ncbi:MAG: helix-hairpin-helix domain-containing protein [Bacteroidetes bacterium]|nr:helix-hairpin-helix domain-containing protein [Bacteroidota bacterium]MBS1756144.1 helix-hairpin-helix domain-containing protein [Bacteroidota bacterium]
MKKLFFLSFLLLIFGLAKAQVKETPVSSSTEEELENITANNDDMETEDDSYLQEMVQFQRNPINLNYADADDLNELKVLSPMQVQNLISYRTILGKFLSIYEIQAIPGWDINTIRKIRPYITVSEEANLFSSFKDRLKGGNRSLLVRAGQTLEKAKGYLVDPSVSNSYYPGSPQKLFVRFKYSYKNLLQYGVVGEKDPGEQFFKGGQKQGFDFYSAHFFLRNSGIIKSLALGDYTVNLGQGLTQWMNLAYKKGPDILSVKRESPVLRPYSSSGEINFHRGAGITIGKNKWEATIFGSYKKVDANFNAADTSQSMDEFVSSLQTSGYHRTPSELANKGSQTQMAFGGNFSYQLNRLHLGINAIQYHFKYPLIKENYPYNLYALSGKSFGNYSLDYSYTYKNMHFFGEAATSQKKYGALVSGLLISVAKNVDMSFLYRNISKGYQSLYSNAFTEGTYPTNERGFFSGISVRPNDAWRIDAYADMYKFPWLKFRIDAPSTGSDYLLQATYKPNKQLEMYMRYKSETKSINDNPNDITLNPIVPKPKKDWRTQFTFKVSPVVTLRSRAEVVWYDKKGDDASQGFLFYTDVFYVPPMAKFSGNIRLQYFQTDDYNSRLYAYESDVLYNFSIPVFYGTGYKYYINLNYDAGKKLSFWGKFAQTIYPNQQSISSGLDLINKNHKTEVRLQMIYKF